MDKFLPCFLVALIGAIFIFLSACMAHDAEMDAYDANLLACGSVYFALCAVFMCFATSVAIRDNYLGQLATDFCSANKM